MSPDITFTRQVFFISHSAFLTSQGLLSLTMTFIQLQSDFSTSLGNPHFHSGFLSPKCGFPRDVEKSEGSPANVKKLPHYN
jgi:hypothetical protein